MRTRRRQIGSAQISEFSAVLVLFFLALLFPMINFISLATATATGYFAARHCANRAGNSSDYKHAIQAAEEASREIADSGFGKFAGLKTVGGYNNSGMNLYVTDTNVDTNVNIVHGPNTPAVSALDPDHYVYSYEAVVTYDVGPFLNLQGVPFVGDIVGLGKPVRMVFESSRAIEHLDGLTIGGGGFIYSGSINTSDTHSVLGALSGGGAVASAGVFSGDGSSYMASNSSGVYQASAAPRRPWQVASTNGVTRYIPNVVSSFHVQLTGEVDFNLPVDVLESDMYETSAADVATIHSHGGYAIAYMNCGAWQPGMPDSDLYPPSVIGQEPMAGWPEERWLDIRQIAILRPIIQQKLQVAKDKGFDAVDPDNMDGYTNTDEFHLTKAAQIAFNQMVAEEAHALGLAVMLKNSGSMMDELVNDFDGTVAEQAYRYKEADIYQQMRDSGKPVFVIEYGNPGKKGIQDAIARGYNMIKAKKNLKGRSKMLTPS